MKRREFVINAATVVGTLPLVRAALGQTPCPPGTLSIEGGTSGTTVACGEGATSSLIQVANTPEQIALYADASSFDATAYATLDYKLTSASTWSQGHPLYRVRPGTTEDAFAGCIFDLQPGQMYDIRVTFTDGSGSLQEQAQFSTRRLPADVSQRSPDASPSSISALQTAINSASPGDIIELQDGIYTGSFSVSVSGTSANPIYIRGQSRTGTVINASSRITMNAANYVVLENMTIDRNRPVDDSTQLDHAIRIGTTGSTVTDLTFRNLLIRDTVLGIATAGGSSGGYSHNILVYNNEITGTLQWSSANITGSKWGNDGIRLVGHGNCVWNNTIEGFSDAVTFAHSIDESAVDLECNYAYRNHIRNSLDNVFELDHALRFHAVYDNYCENMNTGVSQSDNATRQWGPTYTFRNIFVNIAKKWTKFNAGWHGWHHYNNTYVRSDSIAGDAHDNQGFFNDPGGTPDQDRFSYRNNLHVWTQPTAGGRLIYFDFLQQPTQSGFDVSHNAWYPADGDVQWATYGPARFSSVQEAIDSTDTHNTLYPSLSGLTPTNRYHDQDVITTINPWTNTLTLGATAETEVIGMTALELDSGSNAKNAGVAIPGITDGFSGVAPDIGAIIGGREPPVWGAQ